MLLPVVGSRWKWNGVFVAAAKVQNRQLSLFTWVGSLVWETAQLIVLNNNGLYAGGYHKIVWRFLWVEVRLVVFRRTLIDIRVIGWLYYQCWRPSLSVLVLRSWHLCSLSRSDALRWRRQVGYTDQFSWKSTCSKVLSLLNTSASQNPNSGMGLQLEYCEEVFQPLGVLGSPLLMRRLSLN